MNATLWRVAAPSPASRFVAAHFLSNLADGVRYAAFPLVVFSLTSSPTWVAVTFALGLVPSLLLALPVGLLVDRQDRARLLRLAMAVRATLLASLAFTIATEIAPLWLVLVVAVAFGVGEVVTDTTAAALVPSVASPGQLDQVNSRVVTVEIIGNELVGPALGGVLFAIATWLPFGSGTGTLVIALLLLATIDVTARMDTTPSSGSEPIDRDDVRAGLRALGRDRRLWATTAATCALMVVDSMWFSLLVVVVLDLLQLSEGAYGLLLAVGAVGGIAGAWWAPRGGPIDGARLITLILGSMGLCLVAVWAAPSAFTVATTLVVSSAGFAWWNVAAAGVRQRATTDAILGRVSAASRASALLAGLVGALVGGVAAAAFGVRSTLLFAGVGTLVAGVVAMRWLSGVPMGPVRRLSALRP